MSVHLISPDFPERTMLDFVEQEQGGLDYAVFTAPQLVIYSVMVIEYE